jgi:ferredoxin
MPIQFCFTGRSALRSDPQPDPPQQTGSTTNARQQDPLPSVVVPECSRDFNLLGHAQMVELEIGSRCGGHGVCGGDRVRVTEPSPWAGHLSPHTAAEREHLSEEDLARGWRLACQVFPEQNDLSITVEVPRDFSRSQFYQSDVN